MGLRLDCQKGLAGYPGRLQLPSSRVGQLWGAVAAATGATRMKVSILTVKRRVDSGCWPRAAERVEERQDDDHGHPLVHCLRLLLVP
jgi:hypothetical protein